LLVDGGTGLTFVISSVIYLPVNEGVLTSFALSVDKSSVFYCYPIACENVGFVSKNEPEDSCTEDECIL